MNTVRMHPCGASPALGRARPRRRPFSGTPVVRDACSMNVAHAVWELRHHLQVLKKALILTNSNLQSLPHY